MWKILVCVFLILHFETVWSNRTTVAVVHNISMIMCNTNSTITNGTCHDCLCALMINAISPFFFNCFWTNNTCEIFFRSFETGSFMLINNAASSLYFFPPSADDTTLTTSECHLCIVIFLYSHQPLASRKVRLIFHHLAGFET